MEILYYSINIDKLKTIQEQQTTQNREEKRIKEEQGLLNKKRLLKYVLPFVHSVFELHNNKCNLDYNTSTGKRGLLKINKIDIQKELDFIINTDLHLIWSNNYQTFTFLDEINGKNIKIWLNSRDGCHVSTPNLEYSMTSHFDTYGKSIEDELEKIAKFCSRYTDSW